MRGWLWIASSVVVATLPLLPANASAWRRITAPPMLWRTMPVSYQLDEGRVGSMAGGPGLPLAESALEMAVDEWNDAVSGFRGSYAGRVSGGAFGEPRGNEVRWVREWDPALGNPEQVLATTRIQPLGVGPVFTTVETDVIFNGDTFDWDGGIPRHRRGVLIGPASLNSTMLHEIGHSVGLDHSEEEVAVMFALRTTPYETVQPDDVAGAQALYPVGEPLCATNAQCPGTGGRSSRCGPMGECESVPPGALGATCDGSSAVCEMGLECLGLGEDYRCTRDCGDGCDSGTLCVETVTRAICWPPGTATVGADCDTHLDCESTLCLSTACRQACADDCECPVGERCVPLASGIHVAGYCAAGTSTCARCGDGDLAPGEECDEGEENDDLTADRCRTDCRSPHCGDGVVDTAEGCDDGNTEPGDGCDADCAREPEGPRGDGDDAGKSHGPGGAPEGWDDPADAPERGCAVTDGTGPDTPASALLFVGLWLLLRSGLRVRGAGAVQEEVRVLPFVGVVKTWRQADRGRRATAAGRGRRCSRAGPRSTR